MSSLWSKYFAASEKRYTYETENGFVSYHIQDGVCIIQDFYVEPGFRGSKLAMTLAKWVERDAKNKGCTALAGEVYHASPNAEYILRLHRHWGMVQTERDEYKTLSVKELKNDKRRTIIA